MGNMAGATRDRPYGRLGQEKGRGSFQVNSTEATRSSQQFIGCSTHPYGAKQASLGFVVSDLYTIIPTTSCVPPFPAVSRVASEKLIDEYASAGVTQGGFVGGAGLRCIWFDCIRIARGQQEAARIIARHLLHSRPSRDAHRRGDVSRR